MDVRRKLVLLLMIHQLIFRESFFGVLIVILYQHLHSIYARRPRRANITYSLIRRIPQQVRYLDRIINTGDEHVKDHLRLDRDAFMKLCWLLRDSGGLRPSKYVGISEQVSMFLDILAHHTKYRKIRSHFVRSGQTVSKNFNRVLLALLKIHPILDAKPEPVTANDLDPTWKAFEGCLGALDGTHIKIRSPMEHKAGFRSRKGAISTNVLCICDRKGEFVFCFPGWEGSAADSRVLKDAIKRPDGLKVPNGCYYLCDGGYTNGQGFLTPYKGVRYHLNEWTNGRRQPQNYQEFFNMKHSRARNVIECCFAALKNRWAILRSNSFFPINNQMNIIIACCLLHNFIRREVLNAHLDEEYEDDDDDGGDRNPLHPEEGYVDVVEPSARWTAFRDDMAHNMYNAWRATRR